MNITDAARLVNRSTLAGEMAVSMSAADAVGAAYSVLSIHQAITGKKAIVEEKTLRDLMASIRKRALAMQDRARKVDLVLSEGESNLLRDLKTGGKEILYRGLKHVGRWFIRGLYMGIAGAVVPAFRLITFVTGTALRTILLNPVVLGILAAAGAGYLAWRAFQPKRDTDREVMTPKSTVDASREAGASRDNNVSRQTATLEEGALSSGATASRSGDFTVYEVPKASTATAAPKAEQVTDAKGKKRDDVPFGILYNNPGNIEFANQEGATRRKLKDGTYSRFAVFPSQEEGLYQIGRQLQLYDSRGTSTIRGMISKYAPPNENKTNNYINWVSQQSNTKPDAQVDMSDPKLVEALIRAIVRMEVGHTPYTDAQYADAAKRAIAFRGLKYQDKAWGLQLPTYGRLSSTYGTRLDPVEGKVTRKHKGIDIAAPEGTPVYAAHSGVAHVYPNTKGGYGNLLRIFGDTYNTVYAHLSSFTVSNKDKVKQGELVAKVGNTGRSTGNHLHFEVRDNQDNDINPAKVMNLPAKQISKGNVVLPTAKEMEVVRLNGRLLKLEK